MLAAETPASKTEAPRTDEEGVGGKTLKKVMRGGQNLAFGLVADVPRTIYYESRTFPLPTNDYEPVVLPALPFEPGPTKAFPDVP